MNPYAKRSTQCPNCGKDTDGSGRFCKWCGASLPVERGGSGGLGFDDALYESLSSGGTALLDSPKRLLALTSDVGSQDALEYKVFEHNCDAELLGPYAEAVRHVGDGASLDEAANRATLVLQDRAISEEVAQRTAWDIRNAVARSVGVPRAELREPAAAAHAPAAHVPAAGRDAGPYVPEDTLVVATPAPAYEPTPAPAPPPYPVPEPRRSRAGMVAVVALLGLAMGVALYVLLGARAGIGPLFNGSSAKSRPVVSGVSGSAQSEAAASFSRGWTGTYDGWTTSSAGKQKHISRQVSFDLAEVGDDGSLKGICYIGADDMGSGATSASYNISGTVDWETGKIHLEGTSWIDQGTLAELRQYNGTVDFSDETMTGTASDADSGDYEGSWSMYATDVIDVNVPVQTQTPSPVTTQTTPVAQPVAESDPQQSTDGQSQNNESSTSRAADFPRSWSGTYDGYDGEDRKISRSVTFDFTSVSDGGDLEGTCYVGVDEKGVGATNASYRISGHVDWDSGEVYVAGTEWLHDGGLKDLRQYEGTVDFGAKSMSGIASDVGTHDYEGAWRMSA